MCLAKWNEVTIHFHQGVTHSCHHNPTHLIVKKNLLDNPSGLHNTDIKLKHRRQMLNGRQPNDCNYCWRVENSGNPISDRILKSSYQENWPFFSEIVDSILGEKYWPRNMEVSFSSTCQFKCSYCSANFSSKWQSEIDEHGRYFFGKNNLKFPIINEDENDYIKTFWNWWPDLRKHLRTFRITGGEPLLSKNTFRLLKEIEANPLPELNLAVNSNLGVSGKPFEDFIDHIKKLTSDKSVKQFTVFTSIDSFGAQAEYIRHGLNLKIFIANIERLLSECPKVKLIFMVTFNALSPFQFHDFLDYYENLKEKYSNDELFFRIGIDINYLRDPIQLSLPVLGTKASTLCQSIVDRMTATLKKNQNARIDLAYTSNEIEKARHILQQSQIKWNYLYLKLMQKRFLFFFRQHDRRRGTNLFSTFPELKSILKN